MLIVVKEVLQERFPFTKSILEIPPLYAHLVPTPPRSLRLSRHTRKLVDCELAQRVDPKGISGYVSAASTETYRQQALSKLTTALSRARKMSMQRQMSHCRPFRSTFRLHKYSPTRYRLPKIFGLFNNVASDYSPSWRSPKASGMERYSEPS
jgi:hypothetical protein